jgi:hypothetical protein
MPKSDTVGVYLPNHPLKETYRVSRAYARELRNNGLAFFINRANDVRLAFTPEMKFRGESCTVKESLIHRAIDGSRTAQAAINAWRPLARAISA